MHHIRCAIRIAPERVYVRPDARTSCATRGITQRSVNTSRYKPCAAHVGYRVGNENGDEQRTWGTLCSSRGIQGGEWERRRTKNVRNPVQLTWDAGWGMRTETNKEREEPCAALAGYKLRARETGREREELNVLPCKGYWELEGGDLEHCLIGWYATNIF